MDQLKRKFSKLCFEMGFLQPFSFFLSGLKLLILIPSGSVNNMKILHFPDVQIGSNQVGS